MGEEEDGRSRELDDVRRLLFPTLSPEEGWRRIEYAIAAASDDERSRRIEEIAADPDLDAVLLATLRERLRRLTRRPDRQPD